jgi:hypothetical protein
MKKIFVFLCFITCIFLFSCDSDLTKENKILNDTSDWYNVEIVQNGVYGDVSTWCSIPEIKFEDTTGIAQLLDIKWEDYWGTPNCFVKGIPDSLNLKGNRLKVKLRKMKIEEKNDIHCILTMKIDDGPFGVVTDIKNE